MADQRDLEDIYNTLGLEGLQKIIASNPVQFAEQSTSGRVRISPNRTIDLKSGNITQQGDPMPRPRTLTELINVANRVRDPVHGMPKEVGGPLLKSMVQRFQEDAGLSPEQASLKRMVDLPRREREFVAKQGGRGLPPDLIDAIGTPDFRQRLQGAAGSLDRQSLQTLYDLDRKEREFRTKSNKPGKPSPVYEKLRQIAAQGIPLTEDIVMGVTNPTVARLPAYKEALQKRQAEGGEPRLFSLGQFAGLDSGTEDAAPSPEAGMPTSQDERRQRLRGLLTGGGY